MLGQFGGLETEGSFYSESHTSHHFFPLKKKKTRKKALIKLIKTDATVLLFNDKCTCWSFSWQRTVNQLFVQFTFTESSLTKTNNTGKTASCVSDLHLQENLSFQTIHFHHRHILHAFLPSYYSFSHHLHTIDYPLDLEDDTRL